MSKPTVRRAPGDHGPDEKIIEVGNGARTQDAHKGALIGLRNMPTGVLRIEVYCADKGVAVLAPRKGGGLATMLSDGTGVLITQTWDADGTSWYRAHRDQDGALLVEMNDDGEYAFMPSVGVRLADRRMLLAYLAGLHNRPAKALGVRKNHSGQL